MTSWRGEPMPHDAAEKSCKVGSAKRARWLAVAGQSRLTITSRTSFNSGIEAKWEWFWYNPVFKVNTRYYVGDRRGDYAVARSPGTFIFTFMDNGVTSEEYWRIVDAAGGYRGLSTITPAQPSLRVLHIGRARHSGGCAAEDRWNASNSLWRGCGVKIWEMCKSIIQPPTTATLRLNRFTNRS